jgi:magnesium transporter
MSITSSQKQLSESILPHIRKDYVKLNQDISVETAIDQIRAAEIGSDGILYLYVVDSNERLMGVLPIRKLLTASHAEKIKNLATPNVAAITHKATIFHACEMFLQHKFLALPVVDDEWRLIGRVDVSLFTEEIVDLTERQKADGIFELLGFRVSQIRKASPFQAWKVRFPWLLATISSGTACAFLAGAFEDTLAKALILAFFLTLVLAVGESVSIQSMTVAIQRLRFAHPTFGWYLKSVTKDLFEGLLLAVSCGAIVALIVGLWSGSALSALVIGSSIFVSLILASILGFSIPSLLHGLRLDPKVAAGPLTLAVTDLATLSTYFLLGKLFLGG